MRFKKTELAGQRFGRLTVIECAGSDKRKHAIWLCKCDCGNYTKVPAGDLSSGNTKSCGCLRIELAKRRGKNATGYKHGETGTNLYKIWTGMKQRCYDSNHPSYQYYGLRQISVCDEWKDNFVAFRDWAIKSGYREGLEMDRRDRNGNYQPNNVRWISKPKHVRKTHKEEKKKKQLQVFKQISVKDEI